jgi:hypothetical protein
MDFIECVRIFCHIVTDIQNRIWAETVNSNPQELWCSRVHKECGDQAAAHKPRAARVVPVWAIVSKRDWSLLHSHPNIPTHFRGYRHLAFPQVSARRSSDQERPHHTGGPAPWRVHHDQSKRRARCRSLPTGPPGMGRDCPCKSHLNVGSYRGNCLSDYK